MHRYKQDPPFCVQVEMTEGCNLVCPFCAISSIRKPERQGYDYKYLTPENAEKIASLIAEAGWTSRIEFGMHGEPSMNPKFLDIIRIFRTLLPKNLLILESNGVGLSRHTPDKLIMAFNAGIDNLAVEDYDGVDYCGPIREIAYLLAQPLKEMGVRIYEYPSNREGNPHQRGKTRKLSFMEDLASASKGTHSDIHNSAGLAAEKHDLRSEERCAKPFREISVRWDGNVAICCNDWRGDYKVGNVLESESIEDLWQSDPFVAARLKLYRGQRDFGPCDGCDARSYRVGLLPDKFGKVHLPRADEEAAEIIGNALAGKPFTAPVMRDWELVKIKGVK